MKKKIDALEDQEIWIKHRQSGLKSPDKALSRAFQIETMYEAEPSGSKGWSVQGVVQLYRSRRRMSENSELVEVRKQNTYVMNQIINFAQKQQPSKGCEQKRNGRGQVLNTGCARDLRFRLFFKFHKKGHLMADC